MPVAEGTRILTVEGFKPVEELGDQAFAIDPVAGQPVAICANPIGRRYCLSYILTPPFGSKEGRHWRFVSPLPCRFPLVDDGSTWDLRLKDLIEPMRTDCGYDAASWASGFMYRQGITSPLNLDPRKYPLFNQRLETILKTEVQFQTPIALPGPEASPKQIGSFIKGYIASDGNHDKIKTTDKSFLDWFAEHANYAGLVITGQALSFRRSIKDSQRRVSFYSEFQIAYTKAQELKGFRVNEINAQERGLPYECYEVKLFGNAQTFTIEGGWTVFSD